jgi:hypothetical protein
MTVTRQFVSDMEHITKWIESCETVPQLKNCAKMLDTKIAAMEIHFKRNRKPREELLYIGDAIGTATGTLASRIKNLHLN